MHDMSLADQMASNPTVLLAKVRLLIPACATEKPEAIAAAVDLLLDDAGHLDGWLDITRPVLGSNGADDLLSDMMSLAEKACGDEPQTYTHPNDPSVDHDGRWERWDNACWAARAAAGREFVRDMVPMLRRLDALFAAAARQSSVELVA